MALGLTIALELLLATNARMGDEPRRLCGETLRNAGWLGGCKGVRDLLLLLLSSLSSGDKVRINNAPASG